MTLQSSGAISLDNIRAEFGGSTPVNLNDYYRSGAIVSNSVVNNNIPTTGSIALSDFYLAKATGDLDFAYHGIVTSSSNAWTYTFNNVPIGTATSDRLVVLTVQINASPETSYYISNVTIGGVNATPVAKGASDKNCWIVSRLVTTGTTANIVVTLDGSGTPGRCIVMTYSIKNYTSTTPVLTHENLSGTGSISQALTYRSGMVAIANATQLTEPTQFTWSGLTENADTNVENTRHSSASGRITTNSTSVSATADNASVSVYGSIAVWR